MNWAGWVVGASGGAANETRLLNNVTAAIEKRRNDLIAADYRRGAMQNESRTQLCKTKTALN
jgi:hypothetical protein